ncbi:uncharacterized protein LOC111703924 isoform X2 [Eurytemora carolleeae]|uniref:uncharacterized protein LOC111703924 isoform X1 n=1 Tax=Eurytemora carolleeae TaxID=1294199 RepID=UPI000C788473|nr:uncharacterized protein LOC111703924 isoform X1 [Eurytemora carolleeae]XP_023331782.1 uncharacterized protein LOC111703924 isoform X2 [Eurytemora carolleeae]|eukprot:XP_023331781.1 uncharacterized protein LOC111703924 isoform X1 [Eurytemora affinis]
MKLKYLALTVFISVQGLLGQNLEDIAKDLKIFQTDDIYPTSQFSTKAKVENGKWKSKKPTEIEKKFRILEREKEEEDRIKKEEEEKKKKLDTGKKKKNMSIKDKSKIKKSDDTYLKDEKGQLCQSMSEDSVKDTLLKFGLVTHIIPEVEKFRSSIKLLKDSLPQKKKRKENRSSAKKDKLGVLKDGTTVKLTQSNFVGRSFSLASLLNPMRDDLAEIYEDGDNNVVKRREERRGRDKRTPEDIASYLGAMKRDTKRKGTSRNFDQVPECYGWRYLTAISAISPDNSADVDVLTQSVSDMLDNTFAELVADILTSCSDRLEVPDMCPPMEDSKPGEDDQPLLAGLTCNSTCQLNDDCGFQELCCRQSCGGNSCLSVLGPKYNKCEFADQYMQCVYNMIDTQICADNPGHTIFSKVT